MASPDPHIRTAVDIVATELGALTEAQPGRNYDPGADLTSAPAVGIAAGFPWAQWRVLGRVLEVAWTVRVIVGRWESGPSLELALGTYFAASPKLRRAGFDVGDLEPPTLATIGSVPMLAAIFPISYSTKE